MSDDSFIREVNEEMRQDQARALWDRYGPFALALAVLVVLATAGFVAWEYWTTSRASRSGDAFSQALTLANEGKNDEALGALQQLQADGYGAYPLLARMRAALILVDSGSYADVSARAEALTSDTNPLRHSAREALGLAAWKEGRSSDALKLFEQIASDDGAPRNNRERATLLAELIRGQGTAS